jgi:hypothetical protein
VGPIAFVLVFLLVPLVAACFAAAYYTTIGLWRAVNAVPTGAWAALAVTAGVAMAARLLMVLRTLRASPRKLS